MAASNKDRPNLKICIDNSEPNSDVGASSSDEDEVVIHTHFDEDSSMEEDGDRASDSEERARREAVVRVTASSFKTKGEARLLSSIPAFKKSTDAKVKKESSRKSQVVKSTTEPVEKSQLKELYQSLGLPDDDLQIKTEYRLDAIHLKGIDGMSTSDILEFFKGHDPESVEKIDSSSCNVIWSDTSKAARAMLDLSAAPKSKEIKKEDIKKPSSNKESTEEKSSPKEEVKKGENVESEEDDELNLMSDDEEEKKSDENAKSNGTDTEKVPERTEEPMKEEKEEHEEGELSDDNDQDSEGAQTNNSGESDGVPSGKWRKGKSCPKDQVIYMRYALKSEKASTNSDHRKEGEGIEERLGTTPGLTSASNRKRKFGGAHMDYEEGEATDSSESEEEEEEMEAQYQLFEKRPVQQKRRRIHHETIFDLHTRDAQSQRLKQVSIKNRLQQWSDVEDEGASSDGDDAIVDIDELIAPPKPKRTMRMHADDEEEQVRAKRLKVLTTGVLNRNARASPPRDIRSRLQLGRRTDRDERFDDWHDDRYDDRYDDNREWDDRAVQQRRPQFRDISSSDDRRPEPRNTGPPAREDLWRERREPFALDPRAMEQKRNGVWNRNPDWDQDRYKDLDAPLEEEDIFSVAAPIEEFGVIADDVQRRIKAEAMKSKKLVREESKEMKMEVGSKERQTEDDDYFDLNEEEDEEEEEEGGKGSRPRKDWKLKSESRRQESDLRSKLKSRDNDKW